jgi:RNA recognition motif-containing protein
MRHGSRANVLPRDSEENTSIFLGNLPQDVTQQELVSTFEKYGMVVSAQVISRTSPLGKFYF